MLTLKTPKTPELNLVLSKTHWEIGDLISSGEIKPAVKNAAGHDLLMQAILSEAKPAQIGVLVERGKADIASALGVLDGQCAKILIAHQNNNSRPYVGRVTRRVLMQMLSLALAGENDTPQNRLNYRHVSTILEASKKSRPQREMRQK